MRKLLSSAAVMLASALAAQAPQPPAPPSPARSAPQALPGTLCAAPQKHQLDFWLGDWNVFITGKGGKPIATSHIEPLLNGCGVRESYTSPVAPGGPYSGTSYSAYKTRENSGTSSTSTPMATRPG